MYIALVNSFPNRAETAELEFITRFKLAAQRVGHVAQEVSTSGDILACEPDFVIATHEYIPKLTHHITLGAMWNPPPFFHHDEYRVRAVLSHDGHLVGSQPVRQYLEDLEYSVGVNKPKSEFLFLPTSPIIRVPKAPAKRELVYTGIHWDGFRHGPLLARLSSSGLLNVYGPEASWSSLSSSYCGQIPFDGFSLYTALAKHGIALCFNTEAHRQFDTPSMRLFEAAAAGCVIISDEIPFARRVLGDSAFYVDLSESPDRNTEKILEYVSMLHSDPTRAYQMASESTTKLQQFSLEHLVVQACEFAQSVKQQSHNARRRAVTMLQTQIGDPCSKPAPLVDVIVRAGERSISTLTRALRCITQQDFGTYRVLLVDYKGRDDIRTLSEREMTPRVSIKYLTSPDNGLRSTTMWTGLRHVEAPFFAMLDDDDEIMSNHFSALIQRAVESPNHGLYYSGVIRVEDEEDVFCAPNFSGSLGLKIEEKRELHMLDLYELDDLLKLEWVPLTINSWIARRELLDDDVLQDPCFPVMEDPYFYLLLIAKTRFMCNFHPTAIWKFRSTSRDQSILMENRLDLEREIRRRISTRLRSLRFPAENRLLLEEQLNSLPFPEDTLVPLDLAHFRPYKKSGLAYSEAAGTWTSDRHSHFRLDLREPARRLELQFEVTAPEIPLGRQWVNIAVSGQTFFSGELPPWQRTALKSEVEFAHPLTALDFWIECRATIKEKGVGWQSELRKLGVLLHTLCIRRIDSGRQPEPSRNE